MNSGSVLNETRQAAMDFLSMSKKKKKIINPLAHKCCNSETAYQDL